MSAITRRTALVLSIIIVILATNNIAYYFSTKAMLINELDQKMETVAKQMRISIEQSEVAQVFIESLLAQNLRTASIAVKYALDPDIEQVTNLQLMQLRDELDVAHISLFVKTEDDIVSHRWTEPEEAFLGTNNWGYWYDAFLQLMALETVDVGRGQTLPHFWSGPYEISTADPSETYKWGYFYDGTTNYMIDPYIRLDKIGEYAEQVGPDAVVGKLVEQNDFVREITVFNHEIFGTEPKVSRNAKNETWVHLARRPILYGTYEYGHPELDVSGVHTSMAENRIVARQMTVGEDRLYKMYIPVRDSELPYVIGITSDYAIIQDKLNEQFRFLALIVLTGSLLSLAIIIGVVRLFERRRDIAVRSTQEAYIREVNELFTTIRGQRHDFLNQVQTIHTMATLGKLDDLKSFTAELIGEIRVINDIIRIGNPALAALTQAKVVSAANRKIRFLYQISDLDDVELGIKSVDIVKIIGNLVDNAFDEVAGLDEADRQVELKVVEQSGHLCIEVKNPGRVISDEDLARLADTGYTTRSDGKHHGLGLAIIRERVRHYRGDMRMTNPPEGGLKVEVMIPLE